MKFSILRLFLLYLISVPLLYAGDARCLQTAVLQIRENYPASAELLAFTGAPAFLSGLIDCGNGHPPESLLPNLYHELVHYSGFKLLGLGADRIRVEKTDIARISSARTEDDLDDEGFFLGAKKKLTIRGLQTPDRRELFGRITAELRQNPNFEIYLGGEEDGGLLTLIDELHAYTEELKYATAVYPRSIPPGKRTIQKDNVVAFQYMILFYLQNLRQKHPDSYSSVKNNADLKMLLQSVFDDSEQALHAVRDETKFPKLRYAWPRVKQHASRLKEELMRFIP